MGTNPADARCPEGFSGAKGRDMATRKKAKASKKAVKRGQKKTKAKKAPARKKAKSRKASARKPAKKASKRTAARATPRKTAAKKKAPARAASAGSRATAKGRATKDKRKQIVGEGDYEASRTFLKDQSEFVKENKARIPEMGKQARAALEGSEGPALMAAEAEAREHSRGDASEER